MGGGREGGAKGEGGGGGGLEEEGRWGGGGERGEGYSHESWSRCSTHEVPLCYRPVLLFIGKTINLVLVFTEEESSCESGPSSEKDSDRWECCWGGREFCGHDTLAIRT